MPGVEARLLSHPLYAVTNRPDITAVSTHSFNSVETARNQLHPLIGPRSIASFASFTAAGGRLNSSIVVRDPPRERLAGTREETHSERISSDSSDQVSGKSQVNLTSIPIPASTEFYAHLYDEHPLHSQRTRLSPSKSLQYGEKKMAKNRRSLSSILVPSFLQQIPATSPLTSPTSSTFASRMRSQSSASSSVNHSVSNKDTGSRLSTTITTSRDSPPPDFLLDDDPFACLAPVEPVAQRTIQPQPPSGLASSPPNPRSPLMSPKKAVATCPPAASSGSAAHPGLPRAFSAARIQPRPASQKPAFASRPSLPSLHTLSTMNVVLTKKVRKGRVGAGLPFEPWDEEDRTSIARVLQDPTFSNTESLPPGSQPLLPSQICPAPATEELSSSQGFTSLGAAHYDVPLPKLRDDNVSAPFTVGSSSLSPSSSFITADVVTGSNPGLDLADSASDLPNTDHNEDEDIIDLDYLTNLPLDFDVEVDDGSASSSSSVLYTPYYTTSRSSFEEQIASPSSSRFSSSDLSASLSRSMSSTSNSSSTSSASGSEERNSNPLIMRHSGSHALDPTFLDGDDSPGILTRSSSEDSDILNSPPDTDYFQYFPAHRWIDPRLSKDGFHCYSEPENSKDAPLAISPGNFLVLDEEGLEYQPGTSADTVRARSLLPSASTEEAANFAQPPPPDSPRDRGSIHAEVQVKMAAGEMVDGSSWDSNSNHHQAQQQQQDMYTHGASLYQQRDTPTGFYPSMAFSKRMGGRDDDDDDRRDEDGSRRGVTHGASLFDTPSSSEPTTSEDEESTDDYAQDPERSSSTTVSPREFRMPRMLRGSSSDDDDVPLAQRIPTALTAQRTIRRQVRDERQQKRKDRAMRQEGEGTERQPRSRQITLRPAGAGGGIVAPGMVMSSSQEAALHAATTAGYPPRQHAMASHGRPFSPDALARKLQNVQGAEYQSSQFAPSTSHPSFQQPHDIPSFASRTSLETFDPPGALRASRSRSLRDPPPAYSPPSHKSPSSPPPPPLRPMRSFHRVERRTFEEEDRPPLPDAPVARSMTTTRARSRSRVEEPTTITQLQRQRSQSVARDRSASNAHTSFGFEEPPPMPRLSMDDQHHRSLARASPADPPPSRSSKTQADAQRTSRPSTSAGRLQSPGLASASSSPTAVVTQQRIFVGDMQRFNMVEITATTNAGNVIEMIEAQGSLRGSAGNGGWMLWEVAQDFGMERPIRSFELLSDVQASWNKDKMMNTFVVRLTPFAKPLSLAAMPTSSPTHSGYVEWESKRGKWSKRWMQLREHCLWLSKRDNRRDEVMLCSLSNFDAYHFTRAQRAPKPFVFAVKSTDKLSFFENTADYLHKFSCKEADGKIWMEKILIARSYVLHQERQILFSPRVSGNNAATSLSRSGTRKTSGTHTRPIQPLISTIPAYASPTLPVGRNDVFEPGSLLYGQV